MTDLLLHCEGVEHRHNLILGPINHLSLLIPRAVNLLGLHGVHEYGGTLVHHLRCLGRERGGGGGSTCHIQR